MVKFPSQGAAALGSTVALSSVHGTVTITGDTALHVMKSKTIPANSMGKNGVVFLDFFFWATGTNASRTVTVTLGGTTLFTITVTATDNRFYWAKVMVVNRNATNSQYAVLALFVTSTQDGTISTLSGGFGANTATLDTTADQTLAVKGQLVNGSDSLVVEGFDMRTGYSS